MRKESEGVTENLLDSARKEFLQYGFHDASLRRISADSGVSTNSIYTRFGDKSGLFTAIVKEAADELMAIYSDSIKKAGEATDISRAEGAGDEGTDGSICMNSSHMIRAMKRRKNLWQTSEHLTMRAGRR